MKKVIISVDSAADLPQDFAKENGIAVMPMLVVADGKAHRDGVDINGKGVFDYVEKTGIIPKTSAVSPGEYMDFFAPFINSGNAVVLRILQCKLSKCCNGSIVFGCNPGHITVTINADIGQSIGSCEEATPSGIHLVGIGILPCIVAFEI